MYIWSSKLYKLYYAIILSLYDGWMYEDHRDTNDDSFYYPLTL